MVLSRDASKPVDSGSFLRPRTVPQPLIGLHYTHGDITWRVICAEQGLGRERQTAHMRADRGDRVRAQANGVTHALELQNIRAASEAVLQRIRRGAFLAGFRSRTCGTPPRLPTADQRRLPRTSLDGPDLGAALDTNTNRPAWGALQVIGHAQ